MNSLVANFAQILEFAKNYGLPLTKKRAILREYLQVRILDFLYRQKVSLNLFFVGGTSLRLLYGLDRFSEDLDFDLSKKCSTEEVDKLIKNVYQHFLKENIEVELYRNFTLKRAYYEIRFKNLLYQLNLSVNRQEKLTIKFDFEKKWQKQQREIILLNRYGFLIKTVALPKGQLLAQKIWAYLNRKQTLGRDLYDIIWLILQGTKIDQNFLKDNRLSLEIVEKAKEKFLKEKALLRGLKLKLRPFLIEENYLSRLDEFTPLLDLSSCKSFAN